MGKAAKEMPVALGFLTVVEHPQYGLIGGYLVLNLAGRPLEFHCTTPVKPNRAQEILYGASLGPYLHGELIGQALVRKAAVQPLLVCTDRTEVLSMRAWVDQPVALVESPPTAAPPTGDGRVTLFDPPHTSVPVPVRFLVGRNRLAVESAHTADQPAIVAGLAGLHEQFDLAEPFARIREAIDEAQRAGR